MRSTELPPNVTCPWCGYIHDAATSAMRSKPDAVPEPGDVSICLMCAQPSVYTETMRVRKPWPGEVDITDPELRLAMSIIRGLDRRGVK